MAELSLAPCEAQPPNPRVLLSERQWRSEALLAAATAVECARLGGVDDSQAVARYCAAVLDNCRAAAAGMGSLSTKNQRGERVRRSGLTPTDTQPPGDIDDSASVADVGNNGKCARRYLTLVYLHLLWLRSLPTGHRLELR